MQRILILIGLFLVVGGVQAGPTIQTWRMDNGARVYFVNAPEIPMVDIRVLFDAGGARDGARPGLAQLTNAMLNEGAGGLTAEGISERFDQYGAQQGGGVQLDMAWVQLRSITDKKHLDPVLELLATLLKQPDFPKKAFERLRQQMLVGLDYKKQDPGQVADAAFYQAVYQDHPYANDPDGTPESLAALQPKDLKAFHKKHYVANNAVVAIVGDVDLAQAKTLAQKVVGELPRGRRAKTLPPVRPIKNPGEIKIAHPSTQTHIRLGQPGVKRNDRDYFTLYVANHVLGGSGLVSILSTEVREKRGLSYSVYSHFSPMRMLGPFKAGLQTKNTQAEEALKVLKKTIKRYVEKGPSEEQLEASKLNITGGFPLNVDSNAKIIGYLAMIGFYGLSTNYLETFIDHINQVTQEDIKDALKRRLDVDEMVTVVVGGGE